MTNGKIAVVVEVLEQQKAYIVGVEIDNGDYETETIKHSDIASVFIEVETPIQGVV